MSELFIVAAPSGTGVTALVDRVLASAPERARGLHRAVGHTTRQRREGERDGREYHFVDRERFERLIDQQRLLEWSEYGGSLYGTARDEVDSWLGRGVDVLVEIDLAGAERLRASRAEARTVAVLPAGSAVSSSEKKPYGHYECVIMLDDAARAAGALAATLFRSQD